MKNEIAMTEATSYNGWANYETWNVSLWIQNDQYLYNTAKACVEYCSDDDTPYLKFIRCMSNCGRPATKDGVRYDNLAVDVAEIEAMMVEL
jgi:hypothetical protein